MAPQYLITDSSLERVAIKQSSRARIANNVRTSESNIASKLISLRYARTFCPVACLNCIFQYFHDWRYIYFSLRELCCCSCVFPSDKNRYVKANGLVDSVA